MAAKEDKPEAPQTVGNPLVIMNKMIEKGIEPDALKKMMDLYERWQEQQAKAMYASAMNECQRSMPAVVKNAENKDRKSRYANLEAVNAAITPVYTAQGFSISFSEEPCPTLGSCRIAATIRHVGGAIDKAIADIPLDGVGIKGAPVMTATQGKGSTLAYGRRYLLHLIFNLTIADEDVDGQVQGATLDQDQIKVINELMTDCTNEGQGVDYAKFLAFLLGDGVQGDLGAVSQAKFAVAVDFLNRRLRLMRAIKEALADEPEIADKVFVERFKTNAGLVTAMRAMMLGKGDAAE